MNVLVDTSVWSLAMRRDEKEHRAVVQKLKSWLEGGAAIFTTGFIVQELVQGFAGPRAAGLIASTLSKLPLIVPKLDDHIEAASLRNLCRRRGVQLGTIDALIAQICITHRSSLLTTDRDFEMAQRFCPLQLVKLD